jgi:uncharacterized protein YchJ
MEFDATHARVMQLKEFVLASLQGLMANPVYHQKEMQVSLQSRGLTVEKMAVQTGAIAMVEFENFFKSAQKEGKSSELEIV